MIGSEPTKALCHVCKAESVAFIPDLRPDCADCTGEFNHGHVRVCNDHLAVFCAEQALKDRGPVAAVTVLGRHVNGDAS